MRQRVENLQGQLAAMPVELRANARLIREAEFASAQARNETMEEWRERNAKLSDSKNGEIANLKEKYEFLLQAKGDKLRKFVDEFQAYKAKSEEVAAEVRAEVQLLYEYTEKLTHVMERIECE